jgi:hypothetical protein
MDQKLDHRDSRCHSKRLRSTQPMEYLMRQVNVSWIFLDLKYENGRIERYFVVTKQEFR